AQQQAAICLQILWCRLPRLLEILNRVLEVSAIQRGLPFFQQVRRRSRSLPTHCAVEVCQCQQQRTAIFDQTASLHGFLVFSASSMALRNFWTAGTVGCCSPSCAIYRQSGPASRTSTRAGKTANTSSGNPTSSTAVRRRLSRRST